MNDDVFKIQVIDVLSRLVGGSGEAIFADTDAHTMKFDLVIIREDSTQIDSLLDINGEELIVAATADAPYNISGVDLLKGVDIIAAEPGQYFTGITLGAGSVGCFKRR